MASKVELQKSLARYEEALAQKSTNLPDLDDWYRKELQSTVQARKSSKEGAYLTTTELVKLMKWKLTVRNRRRKQINLNKNSGSSFSHHFREESFVRVLSSSLVAIRMTSSKPQLKKHFHCLITRPAWTVRKGVY